MSFQKGTAVDTARRMLQKAGVDERKFCDKLGPKLAATFHAAMPVSWIPIQEGSQILEIAAAELFPNQLEPMRRLGYELALDNLRGVYRILMRVSSVAFVIKQSATYWSAYNQAGKAAVSDLEQNRLVFTVTEHPNFPPAMQVNTAGYIAGVLSLAGAKDVVVDIEGRSPGAMRWPVRWSNNP